MIEAKELRFGNLIDTVSIKAEKVTGLSKNICTTENNQVSYDCAYPIPLSEEWLLKFGFKKEEQIIKDGQFKGLKFDANYFKDWIRFYKVTGDGYYQLKSVTGFVPITIHYVHQLQNLYFVLTGEELIIKISESEDDKKVRELLYEQNRITKHIDKFKLPDNLK